MAEYAAVHAWAKCESGSKQRKASMQVAPLSPLGEALSIFLSTSIILAARI
jgi:hypothetical protein